MSILLDQIPSLKILLDFDGLTKKTSVYKFQGRLEFLLENINRELADFKVNAKNPDLVEEALLNHVKEAIQFSGGNLSSIKPVLLNIFGYRTFNLKTDFDIEKEQIRQLLIWSPDCTWSYNKLWEELKPNTQSSPASSLSAPDPYTVCFRSVVPRSIKDPCSVSKKLTRRKKT